MRKTLGIIASLVLATGRAYAQANSGAIAVTWDPRSLVCEHVQEAGTDGVLYVVAVLGGEFADGTEGAEFRIEGFPSEWSVTSLTPNPGAKLVLGNPLGQGCEIGFPFCYGAGRDGTNLVWLYSIRFRANSRISGQVISIRAHASPSIPELQCPFMFNCAWPNWGAACAVGGTAAVNFPGYCTSSVTPRTWSEVKSLLK